MVYEIVEPYYTHTAGVQVESQSNGTATGKLR